MIDCCFSTRNNSKKDEQLIDNYNIKNINYIKNKIKKNKNKADRECCMGTVYIFSSIAGVITTIISLGSTSPGTITATIVCSAAAFNSFSNSNYYREKEKNLNNLLDNTINSDFKN